MFTTVCPGCEASLNAPDTLKGKKVKCKKCGEPFVARAASDDEEETPRKTVKMKSVPPPASKSRSKSDDDDVTDEAPSLKGKKSKRSSDDEDTEVMEAARNRDEDDDEPKPKKKKKGTGKGKSKKKEGSPALLIILIAVGAIVLLGGGSVGAYFLFFKEEDKPTNPITKGGTTPETPKQGGVAVAATTGWVDFHEPEGRYRVKFPQQPLPSIVQKQPLPTGDSIDVKMVPLTLGTEAFVAGHAIIPLALAELPAEQVLETVGNEQNAKAKGATIKSNKSITYQGVPGREMVIDFPGKKTPTVMRVFVAGGRMILLVAASENASPDSPRIKAFFESLKIE